MCGIAGKFNYRSDEPIDKDLLVRMATSIAHRGPDDSGYFIDQEARLGFAHRRLSIIDLSGGHQPMANATEDLWIVFNGEIYNYPELKKELQARGAQFRTTCDTEVIIKMYEAYGERSFARLNGIFAFALYDKKKRSVILARDHFGVKPLYYRVGGGTLLFGSEIKTILQDSSVRREIDFESFNTFLTLRYNPSPQTLFKGIRKLGPGQYLKATLDADVEVASYWEYRPTTNRKISIQEAEEEYSRLLGAAVRRQMLSDVPVGLFLSGGVDSAVLGHLMKESTGDPIKSFSVGFEGKGDYNELADSRVSASHLGLEHFEMTISQKEYLEFFVRSFQFSEEPIAETTIPALFYLSKLAAQHVKVVLAGQGADEPLAGYSRYIGEKYISRYARLFSLLPLKPLSTILPRNERFKRAIYASQYRQEYMRFLGIYTIFTPPMKERLIAKGIREKVKNVDAELIQYWYQQTSGLSDSLSKILYLDTRMLLPDDLLLFGDKMTMANSLEMRVPYLDLELVLFLESLPSHFKLKGTTGKYIHKRASAKWIPPEIIHRKKRGFVTPMDKWLQSSLAGFARRLINAPHSGCREYFDTAYINTMIDDHQRHRENYQRHIFALLSFELWYQTFFLDKKVDTGIMVDVQ